MKAKFAKSAKKAPAKKTGKVVSKVAKKAPAKKAAQPAPKDTGKEASVPDVKRVVTVHAKGSVVESFDKLPPQMSTGSAIYPFDKLEPGQAIFLEIPADSKDRAKDATNKRALLFGAYYRFVETHPESKDWKRAVRIERFPADHELAGQPKRVGFYRLKPEAAK